MKWSALAKKTGASKRKTVSLLTTVRPATAADLRLVHIRNTLDLARRRVSARCLERLPVPPAAAIDPTPRAPVFNSRGDLESPFGGA